MILLDADILVVDARYPNDMRFAENRLALDHMQGSNFVAGITTSVLLEVIGVLSFNVSPANVSQMLHLLPLQYGLTVVPSIQQHPEYSGCTIDELTAQMAKQMALGDAVLAMQIEKFAADADCLLSWNAKHCQGKVVVPVFTPTEWLTQQGLIP